MADTATHLVDAVLPRVPVRQWVLSVPRPIRYLLARDSRLLTAVRGVFIRELLGDLRRRSGIRGARGGAVTAIQRFGGSLNLNIHFHTLALDGVYEGTRFHRAAVPSRDELDRVLSRTRFKVLRLLVRRGYLEEFGRESGWRVRDDEPSWFDGVRAAAIQGRGTADGRPLGLAGAEEAGSTWPDDKPYCVTSGDGWSLQAGVRIRAGDRAGLERLCGYVLRPALAAERLELLPDGRVAYGFRKARYDGATHVVLTPLQLVEKVAALVAPPRSHLVRYDGVLAAHAKVRKALTEGLGAAPAAGSSAGGCREHPAEGRPSRLRRGGRSRAEWAELMARWLGTDVLACPRCGSRMRMLALIRDRELAGRMLRAMRLPDDSPPVARPRPPPDEAFDFNQGSFEF